jgi:MFS family permease
MSPGALSGSALTVEEALYPRPRTAWWAVAVLIVVCLIGYIDRQIIIFVADDLKASLRLSDFQIGQLQGFGITVFLSLAALPMGWAIDRYNRRNLLIISMMGWVAATVWTAFSDNYASLFASRVGLGVAEAGLYPALISMLADFFPPRRRANSNLIVFAALNVVLGMSYAIGGILVQAVAQLKDSIPEPLAGLETWRLVFLAVAVPIPAAAVLMLTFREPLRKEQAVQLNQSNLLYLLRYMRPRLSSTLAAPICVACLSGSIDITAQWLPIYLIRSSGLDTAEVGTRIGLIASLAIIIGPSLTAVLLRLYKSRPVPELWVLLTGGLLSVGPCLLLLAQAGPTAHLVAFGVLCATGCIATSLYYHILQSVVPNELRGQLVALISILKALAIGTGISVVGALSDLTDLAFSIAVMAAVMVGLNLTLLALAWRGYRQQALAVRAGAASTPVSAPPGEGGELSTAGA